MFEINYPFTLAEKQEALVYDEKFEKFEVKTPKRTTKLEPLCPDCQCYACKVHSESYIAHLIECFEMNAKVLLTIHNA